MTDLQPAVDLLVARSDVDASRLGYMGISYGAAMGALFVGIERWPPESRIGASPPPSARAWMDAGRDVYDPCGWTAASRASDLARADASHPPSPRHTPSTTAAR